MYAVVYRRRMGAGIFKGTYGIVILGFFIVLLLGTLFFAIYIYISRRKRVGKKSLVTPHKYHIVEQHPDVSVNTKENPIQPPSQVTVKLVPSSLPPPTRQLSRTRKKMIRYSEIDEEDSNEPENERTTPNTFRRSIRKYKDKIVYLLNNKSQNSCDDVDKAQCIVAINDGIKSPKRLSLRLRRANSCIVNDSALGQIVFVLRYSNSDEFLTVNLVSGRQIHSSDPKYTVCYPVVSIQLEGYPDTEVTSIYDDAPNPEYDQEFTFDAMTVDKLFTTVLRFIVWDHIANHETRVVGFFHVNLAHFHNTLIENGESGPIRREISAYICEDKLECNGEVLLSLMYDCVTDKIIATIERLKGLVVDEDDIDVYIKISLLLDNDAIQSKRSRTFTSASNISVNQTFEFSALSADLELLTNTTEKKKTSLELKDKELEVKCTSSETLRHNMGILCSVRATTVSKLKRVIGRLHIGRTNVSLSDEEFHWEEMIRQFDSTITQWHLLKSDY